MSSTLLTEASLFTFDALSDTAAHGGIPGYPPTSAGNAVERGWSPLTIAGLILDGVDRDDLSSFTIGTPIEGATITSAAHFYTGDLAGRQTLVIAYRGTDEGEAEFAFQGAQLPPNPLGFQFGWDLYFAAHAVETGAALAFAADPANGIEQVMVVGHSLGGILAELSAARLMAVGAPLQVLADHTQVVTFGSPGSTADAQHLNVLNVVNSDDFVALLSDLSPLFTASGVAREGADLVVDRPEATLPEFAPADLDTVEELFAATQNPALKVEHQIDLYLDSATLLDSAQSYVPGVRDALDDPLRWLAADLDAIRVGTVGSDVLRGGSGDELIFALDDDDVVFGRAGADVLIGGRGSNALHGGPGADVLVGGPDSDLLRGGPGDDLFVIDGGTTLVLGGVGIDTAQFAGSLDEFSLTTVPGRAVVVARAGDPTALALLRNIEFLAFDDQTLSLGRDGLQPVTGTPAAPVALDDLVVTGEAV